MQLHAKALVDLKPRDIVHLNLPGGGGYGNPFERDPQKVFWDVIEGYVSPEAAAKDYGVAVRYTGAPDELVKLPEQWVVDSDKTKELRKAASLER
jgi:N-methylhydantoinase B